MAQLPPAYPGGVFTSLFKTGGTPGQDFQALLERVEPQRRKKTLLKFRDNKKGQGNKKTDVLARVSPYEASLLLQKARTPTALARASQFSKELNAPEVRAKRKVDFDAKNVADNEERVATGDYDWKDASDPSQGAVFTGRHQKELEAEENSKPWRLIGSLGDELQKTGIPGLEQIGKVASSVSTIGSGRKKTLGLLQGMGLSRKDALKLL